MYVLIPMEMKYKLLLLLKFSQYKTFYKKYVLINGNFDKCLVEVESLQKPDILLFVKHGFMM